MMKKQLLAVLLTSTLSVVSLDALAIDAGNGTVTFTGSVGTSTCTGNAQDLSKTISIPSVNPADFGNGASDVAATATPFTVGITNCPAGVTAVTATYTYTKHDNPEIAAIANTGTARGFAVQVNPGTTMIPAQRLDNGATSDVNIASDGTGTLQLVASLHKFANTQEAVVAGDINSPFQIALTYQ